MFKALPHEKEIKLNRTLKILWPDHYIAHDVKNMHGMIQENLIAYRVTRYFILAILFAILFMPLSVVTFPFLLFFLFNRMKKRKFYDHELSLEITRDAPLGSTYQKPVSKPKKIWNKQGKDKKTGTETSNFRAVSKDKYDTTDMYD